MILRLRGGMYHYTSGYNGTGKFTLPSITIGKNSFNYHPCWTWNEFLEYIDVSLKGNGPSLTEKATETALQLHKEELIEKEKKYKQEDEDLIKSIRALLQLDSDSE